MLLQALGLGLKFLRVVLVILYLLKARFAGTERAKYRLWAKQEFSFGTAVADHTIIALLGLAYCCLAPLVAPFCWLYFALALLTQKYQLLYVMTVQYDATGRMWMNVSVAERCKDNRGGWVGKMCGSNKKKGRDEAWRVVRMSCVTPECGNMKLIAFIARVSTRGW
jgi:hypothetical protein